MTRWTWLAAAGLGAIAAGGHAQQVASAPTAAGADDSETIIVTGTRARNRTVLESAAPIDVLSATDLTRAGSSGELAQALQNLTPSFNFPRQSNSGAGDTVRAAQLRGMSPDQVLVLVDGKRRHTTATPNIDTKIGRGTTPVDFNSLPLNAISRVEVLRDGAGAQYGSDAIAGVINVILDKSLGGEAAVTYGVNITNPASVPDQVRDGQTALAQLKYGFALPNGGVLKAGGEYRFAQGTNRAGLDQGAQYLSSDFGGDNGDVYGDPRNLAVLGRQNFKVGDPRVDDGNAWYNLVLPSGSGFEVYSFGTFNTREARGSNFFRYPVVNDFNNNLYQSPIFPNGFRPQSLGRNRDISALVGVRGEAGGWKLDASAGFGENRFVYNLRDTLNYSLGDASPTGGRLAAYRFDQLTFNLDANREFDVGLAGPIGFAAGAEFRREVYRTTPGDPASYSFGPLAGSLPGGFQAGPGLRPQDAGRRQRGVAALYAELSGDLAKGLFADLAGRVEHYSDGNRTSVAGKAALRWAFADGFALRGSVGNSFRAPALAQLTIQSSNLAFGAGGALTNIALLNPTSPTARALGARALRPETSFNLAAGFTANPLPGLTFTLDGFRITVNDRITLGERIDLAGLADADRTRLGLQGYGAINFFNNAVDTRTTGVEGVAAYNRKLGGGDLALSLAASYSRTEISRIAAAPAQLAGLGLTGVLVGIEETNTITTAAPRFKGIGSASWTGDGWNGLVRLTEYGRTVRVFNFGGGFTPTQRFGPRLQVDLEAGKTVGPATLTLGVENALDNYPPLSIGDFNGGGNLAYDILSPIGINGRYVYGRVSVRF